MKSGITRWNCVPSYSGLLCIFLCVAGSVQAFVPFASAMKLATVCGASFENSLQVMRPMLGSRTAVAPVGCGLTCACVPGESGNSWLEAGGVAGGVVGGVDCCAK